MREKIAKLCCEHEGHEWESLPDDDEGRLCKPRFRRDAMCILDAISEDIKKLVNPHRAKKSLAPEVIVRLHAFEDCREKILALLSRPIEEIG